MIASDWVVGSVVVGDQGALVGHADLPVPPDPSSQGEQPLRDPDPDPLRGAAAVLFQSELTLEGVEGALDPLADTPQRPNPARLVGPVRAQQPRPVLADELVELPPGEALVTDQQQAWAQPGALVLEQRRHDLTLAQLRRGQAPRDGQAVRGGQHVQAKAPDGAVVALAVAVAGMAGQRRTADRLTAGRARVESTRRSCSHQLGGWTARSWMASATSGAARRSRRL